MQMTRCFVVLTLGGFLVLAGTTVQAAPEDIQSIPNTVVELPLTGSVKSVDSTHNRLTVQDDFGKVAAVGLAENVQILRDGQTVPAANLKPGDHITVMNRTR